MPRLASPLTVIKIDNSRPRKQRYDLADGSGLYLRVYPTGRKSWVVRYSVRGENHKPVVIGNYPEMQLKEARERAAEVRRQASMSAPIVGKKAEIKARIDASEALLAQQKREAQEARQNSVAVIGKKWLAARRKDWVENTAKRNENNLKNYIVPAVGDIDLRTARSRDFLPFLTELASNTPGNAQKVIQNLHGICDYCIDHGIRDDDQHFVFKRIVSTKNVRHLPAITRVREVGDLIRAIKSYDNEVVRSALLFCAWTVLRPGVVASAQWNEIDMNHAEWVVPAEKMKMRVDHIVSMSTQAMDMLRRMESVRVNQYVFPPQGNSKNEHVHRDALSKALREMGFAGQHTSHGFRAMLRTLGRERLKVDSDILEAALAHSKGDSVRSAYDRAGFYEERKLLMQNWADWLDEQGGVNG